MMIKSVEDKIDIKNSGCVYVITLSSVDGTYAPEDLLVDKYVKNDSTNYIVITGDEPLDSFESITSFLYYLRCIWFCYDNVVVYTGYREDEIQDKLVVFSGFNNVTVKCNNGDINIRW